jgi:hypothetical protein
MAGYKQFTVIFKYSKEAYSHTFGIYFDENERAEGINGSTYDKPIKIEVEDNEITLVRIVGFIEDPVTRINGNRYGFFGKPNNFQFRDGGTYYLKIISGSSGLEVFISEDDPNLGVECEDS